LWASPRKTVVIKPDGEAEIISNHSRSASSEGILVGLRADGWQTAAFNIDPTVDMIYLFKRQIQGRITEAENKHTSTYLQAPNPHQQVAISPQ
ncbi:MAG: hypothetical protein ACC700_15320, partial [Anaerolineales bacterium]